MIQGAQDGIAGLMDYAFTAVEGQTRFVGQDRNGFVLGYSPGYLWAVVDGFWVEPADFTASDGSSVTLASPVTAGASVRLISVPPFNVADCYTKVAADALMNRRRNRIIDPGMRISQEQTNNLLTTSTALTYASDAFFAYRSGSTGGASFQRVALATPGGSPYRVRTTVTAANSAPAAADVLEIQTRIEGIDVADLKYGTASARTVALRFGCRVSVAGTYGIAILNGAQTRTWLGSFTIAPAEVGIDVVKSITLSGDQTGSWATDNSIGYTVVWGLCAGSAAIGVSGWQSGGLVAPNGCNNLMATNGATFDLFDVGLYDVTGMTPGALPPFELDDFQKDQLKCFRYYEVVPFTHIQNVNYFWQTFKALKRVTPSLVLTYQAASGATVDSGGTNADTRYGMRQTTMPNNSYDAVYAANARL